MDGKSPKKSFLSRRLGCPSCGGQVRIPLLWATGIESVFRCRGCGQKFATGYKAGAVLFALAFTLAVVTVNLLCYMAGSGTFMVMFFAAFPLWFLYGFVLRKWWLVRRARKNIRAGSK